MSMNRAILVGAVESSRVALEALARHPDLSVAAVVTLDEALCDRHSDFVDLAVEADAIGCPLIRVANINRDDALAAIGAVDAAYIFVIGWSQICGPRFLDLAPDRVIGYHPAALPRMRGRAALPWTILRQEPITAGTLFWIDRGTDTGAILDQQYFHVAPLETAATLYLKHMHALSTMIDRTLTALARGDAARRVQDEDCATWAARRTPQDGRIDWSAAADDVLRLVRASGRPYPGAFTGADGRQLTIWAGVTTTVGARHFGSPGQIVQVAADGFTVLCGGATALTVTEWSGVDRMPRLHAVFGEVA